VQSFPRSPFELLDHQRRAFGLVRAQIEAKVFGDGQPRKQVMLIEGPPGSGKSVLAARIRSSLVTDERLPKGGAVLTTTSTAQTSNWSRLFQIAGGNRAAAGVVKRAASYVPVTTQMLGRLRQQHGEDFLGDPVSWRENVQLLRDWGVSFQDGAQDEQYLVSVIDEAHALINPEYSEGRGQFGFAPTLGPLAWHIIRCSTVSIFLLDAEQGFRDRENTTSANIRRWAAELGAEVSETISLAGVQFRCAGSIGYFDWIEGLLRGRSASELADLARQWRKMFDVRLLDTPRRLSRRYGRRGQRAAASGCWRATLAHGKPRVPRDHTPCRPRNRTSTSRTPTNLARNASGARSGTSFRRMVATTHGSFRRLQGVRCTLTRSAKSAVRTPSGASISTMLECCGWEISSGVKEDGGRILGMCTTRAWIEALPPPERNAGTDHHMKS